MGDCGLKFLLFVFQYLIGLVFINLVYRMNLFRLLQFESYQCGRHAVRDPRGAWSAMGLNADSLNTKE